MDKGIAASDLVMGKLLSKDALLEHSLYSLFLLRVNNEYFEKMHSNADARHSLALSEKSSVSKGLIIAALLFNYGNTFYDYCEHCSELNFGQTYDMITLWST